MTLLPIQRVVLYKHGVGYFERHGQVEGDATLSLTFRQSEVSDVLKSLTVLDLDGGHIASVSYDSTKPLEQLLQEVALSIPDEGSLVGLIPQLKGARVGLHTGVDEPVEGSVLGVDVKERQTGEGVLRAVMVSVLTDGGAIRSLELHALASIQLLDPALRRDLDFYLRTQLSAKKKDARTFTFFAQGQGKRSVLVSYTLGAPVWKATYRIILGAEGKPPTIQGWAVVDNTQDEDWENVELSLVAGLPVSFVHDLYTPRYIRRPVVAVKERTGVLPPEVEEGIDRMISAPPPAMGELMGSRAFHKTLDALPRAAAISSMPPRVLERTLGDLFEYNIEHPVTIRRNQSALVPIVLREFEGRPVLLYNKATRAANPMRCVEFKNTTGLTLEGGPVTVLEGGSYVGEAMLETMKPDEVRFVPYAVELGVFVLDSIDSHQDEVRRIVVRNKVMTAHHLLIRQTVYVFNNKTDAKPTLYLDHPRDREWELSETPAPFETTENYWRFKLTIAAKGPSKFVVRQKYMISYTHALREVNENTLAHWLEQRYLDPKTEVTLRAVVERQRQAVQAEELVVKLRDERGLIHHEQHRVRENLQTLGDRPSEKDLRERFVRTFNTQEDRLEQIEREVQQHTAERDRCREEIERLLEKLEYDEAL